MKVVVLQGLDATQAACMGSEQLTGEFDTLDNLPAHKVKGIRTVNVAGRAICPNCLVLRFAAMILSAKP
jgi:hypothetical protein